MKKLSLIPYYRSFFLGNGGSFLLGETAVRSGCAVALARLIQQLLDALLRQYDEIPAIQAGRLAETGSFEALMEKKGYFYSLYRVTQP